MRMKGVRTMSLTIKERRVQITGIAGVDGTLSMDYLTAGEGPPLLLLHGLGDSAHSWQWVLPELARHYQVFAPHLPGFGTSAKPDVPYSPAFFAACIMAMLDTLGLEKVALVGNSLGGLIALHLVRAAPARVSALGLVASAGMGRGVTPVLRLLTVPGLGRLIIAWHRTSIGAWQWALSVSGLLFGNPLRVPRAWLVPMYQMARLPGYLEATVATARSELTLKGQREREIQLDSLPDLDLPTLMIWGTRDRVLPPRQAQAAGKRLTHGQLAMIPGSGHLPHVECVDVFVATLSQFLQEYVSEHAAAYG